MDEELDEFTPPPIGHNSNPAASAILRAFVARIERLEEQKKEVSEHIKEVYSEAKGAGLDAKILRKLIAERKKDPETVSEEAALLDMYRAALGMAPIDDIDDTEES